MELQASEPEGARLSQRFPEILSGAGQGGSFALFDTREAALAWLCPRATVP